MPIKTPDSPLSPKVAFDMSDSRDILRYVWSGVLLPKTLDAYKSRINLTGDFDKQLKPMVDKVVQNYGAVQSHCQDFKDDKYPQVVQLASDMYAYAQKAGGKVAGSYYANIIKYGQEYYDALQSGDSDEISRAKNVVDSLIKKELDAIDALKTRADGVKKILNDFDDICRQDKQKLTDAQKPIDELLTGDQGRIDTLTKEIKAKKEELRKDSKEYEYDVTVAATAATYAWIFPWGTIAAAVTIGIYSDKAIKMKATMDALEKLINETSTELLVDMNIVTQGSLIHDDLQIIQDQIAKAIPAIEHMMGAWDAIASDLRTISESVDATDVSEDPIIQGIDAENIVSQWNDLAAEINEYRLTAYISPEETSLEDAKAAFDKVVAEQPPPPKKA